MRLLTYLSGILACLAIIFGSLLRILHLAGAMEVLFVGIVLLVFVYVPILVIYRYRKNRTVNR